MLMLFTECHWHRNNFQKLLNCSMLKVMVTLLHTKCQSDTQVLLLYSESHNDVMMLLLHIECHSYCNTLQVTLTCGDTLKSLFHTQCHSYTQTLITLILCWKSLLVTQWSNCNTLHVIETHSCYCYTVDVIVTVLQ